jgi:hypothetical protein
VAGFTREDGGEEIHHFPGVGLGGVEKVEAICDWKISLNNKQ